MIMHSKNEWVKEKTHSNIAGRNVNQSNVSGGKFGSAQLKP